MVVAYSYTHTDKKSNNIFSKTTQVNLKRNNTKNKHDLWFPIMSLLPVCNTLIKKGLIIFALVLLNSFYKFDMFQVSLYGKKKQVL